MIQDNGKDRLNNTYKPDARPGVNDRILYYGEGAFLFIENEDGSLSMPQKGDYPNAFECIYLFSMGDVSYFRCLEKPKGEKRFITMDLRTVRSLKAFEQKEVFALFTAWHLIDWYDSNRYCGRCGAEMIQDTVERALVCPECGHKIYPRINPAVIVGVIKGDCLLITRYRTGYAHNALVAGFAEIGETLEETVQREVMEETGVRVRNIRYYKSQPWGMAQDLLMGFYCEAEEDAVIRMDPNELKYAEWVRREDIVLQPNDLSLTNEMMKQFKAGRETAGDQ